MIHRTTKVSQLAAAITNYVKDGNKRAWIRLLCSDDKPAPTNTKTLEELKKKHPVAFSDSRIRCHPTGNTRLDVFLVQAEDVQNTHKTFPAGSSGRPDDLTPQHLLDMIMGAQNEKPLGFRECAIFRQTIYYHPKSHIRRKNDRQPNDLEIG